MRHLPGYIEKLDEIKGKKVDIVAVVAFNDAFVMSAWSKANGIKNDDIVSNQPPCAMWKHNAHVHWTHSLPLVARQTCLCAGIHIPIS